MLRRAALHAVAAKYAASGPVMNETRVSPMGTAVTPAISIAARKMRPAARCQGAPLPNSNAAAPVSTPTAPALT